MEDLKNSLLTGFIDKAINSSDKLQPKLIINDLSSSQSVLDSLLTEISQCDQFFICAAFLTKSGVAVLLNTLQEIEAKGVKGQILVSEYLGFTQPEALRSLLQFSNIEVRVATTDNMHGKMYIFDSPQNSTMMIGSSNLTAAALKENNELNINITLERDGAVYESAKAHLNRTWRNASIASLEYIEDYETRYKIYANQRKLIPEKDNSEAIIVTPNKMQKDAIENLRNLRNRGQNKGLIISATGTGKTFLSAFDVKEYCPKKVLFVVHRRNIALAALKTYKSLFGESKTYSLFSGNQRDINADFVFATIQTISKDIHLSNIDPTYFEYLIVDETHRAGADSYQKLIDYFKPEFLLGMTATPERTDGHNIFADFDHNIAYEIRLHRALEEKILSPFHYFGVTDISVDGNAIDGSNFNALVSDQRVEHILKKSKIYGCDDGVIRGLIFCSRKQECIELSEKLNAKGLKTLPLTGEDQESDRENAINRLESDENHDRLDYILTVDIFNEGIDIPRVNQIIMLRPTSSAIVFVQQLGRGLRLADGKKYLTVIDFIGNYQNNYLVPIALYGDTSYSKDKIRRLVSSGSSLIPGSSTINFDEISKKRIFDSIDQSNLSLFKDLKSDYTLLKFELGRVPMMSDFFEFRRRDAFSFVDYSGSYYQFAQRVDSHTVDDLPTPYISLLSAFSKEINNGKRVEESLALEMMIDQHEVSAQSLGDEINKRFKYFPSPETLESVFHNLNLMFATDNVDNKKVPLAEKLGYPIFDERNGIYNPGSNLKEYLSNPIFKAFLIDSIKYSIDVWAQAFANSDLVDGFILYEKYSRKDVFRILNWKQKPIELNVGGYMLNPNKSDCAIFVNYDKHDHGLSTKYVDEFIDQSTFSWMSKNKRSLTSPEILRLQDFSDPMRVPLFIKKSNDEGLDFYYMGELYPIKDSFHETSITNDQGINLPLVAADFKVLPSVKTNIYNYITG
tara:strand:+ start:1297 stop:4191 length:2895 start_codon:yes stop_codon:yes gene_type:complete